MRGWSGRQVVLLAALLLAAPSAIAQSTDTLSSEQSYAKAMHLFHTGAYEQALPLFVSELDVARSQYGLASGEHATALNNLGEVYRQLGQLDEAEEQFVQALAIEEARLGIDDPWLAKPLNNLALVYRAQGRYPEAERNLKRSLQILEDSLGHRHPDVAGSLNNLARLYETTGYPERAEPLLQRALMIARNTLGDAHPTTQHVQANLDRLHTTAAVTVAPEPSDAPPEDTVMAAATTGAPTSLTLPPPTARPTAAAAPEAIVSPTPKPTRTAAVTEAAVEPSEIETETVVAAVEVAQAAPLAALPEPLPEPSAAPADIALADPAAALPAPNDLESEQLEEDQALPVAASASPVEDLAALNGVAEAGLLVPTPRPAGQRWRQLPEGRFAIHLASVRSPISATEEWQRLRDALGLSPDIDQLEPERIELAEQGVFYRVIAGPFPTRDAAAAACGSVRRMDAYCGVLAQAH